MPTEVTPSSQAVYYLQHLAFVLIRSYDQILQEQLGIGFAQYKILRLLSENSGVKQNELAAQLMQSEASISRQIKLLRIKGLVVSQINVKNRREHVTVPTSKALQLTEVAQELLDQFSARSLQTLDQKSQSNLSEALHKIYQQVLT